MRELTVIGEARFDPKLKLYWFLSVLLTFVATVAGLVLVPFWLIGWGQWWASRAFENLQCILTPRSLVVRRGVLFKTEKTIPLDKIQDLTLKEGPLLRWFGLLSIRVETAGQGANQGSSEASLIGVVEAREFRDRVLDQRDLVTGIHPSAETGGEISPPAGDSSMTRLLSDIRDTLRRIETRLNREP